jgi:hypothetical protein
MDELNEQWARLLAAGKVRWMAGMLPERDDRVVNVDENNKGKYITLAYIDRGHEYGCNCSLEHSDLASDTPDWTDPATLGCLLAMARSAWRAPLLGTGGSYFLGGIHWGLRAGGRMERGGKFLRLSSKVFDTEAGALLAAIEVAP